MKCSDGHFPYGKGIFELNLLFLMVMLIPDGLAMPPHPDVGDGNQGKIDLSAYKTALNTDAEIDLPSRLLRAEREEISGTFKALAILIDFTDKTSSVDAADFDTVLFVNQFGSLRHYYREVSYGQLDIITLTLPSSLGWITAPQTYLNYCNGQYGTGAYPRNTQKLCEDIVDLVDPYINFSEYDNNSDGYVDALILIHAGPGAELFGLDSTDHIWSHKWSISPRSKDGVNIYEYTIQPEYWYSPGDITCGVFCHEMGHIFGLPDLYDRDISSNGIGRWSLMAYGCWLGPSGLGGVPAAPEAWSRLQLGFNDYTNITANTNAISILNIEEGGPIYRLWSAGGNGSEYYLLENRQNIGYDAYLPESGLLIWHIDETQAGPLNSNNDNEWYPGFTSNGNYLVALEQADGLYEMDKKISKGNAGDPFPGSGSITNFAPSTVPSSNSYDGDNTYVSVSNISTSGSVMFADFQISLLSNINEQFSTPLPLLFVLGQNYPNPFNPATSIEIDLVYQSEVSLTIYDILGRQVDQPVNKILMPGRHLISWNCQEKNGGKISSGLYIYRLVTEFGADSKKMILTR
jgi:immune inhibitor A